MSTKATTSLSHNSHKKKQRKTSNLKNPHQRFLAPRLAVTWQARTDTTPQLTRFLSAARFRNLPASRRSRTRQPCAGQDRSGVCVIGSAFLHIGVSHLLIRSIHSTPPLQSLQVGLCTRGPLLRSLRTLRSNSQSLSSHSAIMGNSCSQATMDTEDFARAFPLELGLKILANLDATSLCKAALVCRLWRTLASSDTLWMRLSNEDLGGQLNHDVARNSKMKWKAVYRVINQSICLFNKNPNMGMETLLLFGALQSSPEAVALFLFRNPRRRLRKRKILEYLTSGNRWEENLRAFVHLHTAQGVFLVDSMRQLLRSLVFPNISGATNVKVLEIFADYYWESNQHVCQSKDTIFVICFSLLMLASDLSSPAVKNKMSKREFIRNVRKCLPETETISTEYLGSLYDNLFLGGLGCWKPLSTSKSIAQQAEYNQHDVDDDFVDFGVGGSLFRTDKMTTRAMRCRALLNRLDGRNVSSQLVELSA